MAKTKKDELANIKLPAPDSKQKGGFLFLNPVGGEIFEVGSKVAIYWTGGNPLPQSYSIYLIDIEDWVSLGPIVLNQQQTSSPGLYKWTIPLTWLNTHNHTKYCFYIVSGIYYRYSETFKIT